MKVDLSQVSHYKDEIQRHRAKQQEIKVALDFNRLQLKQAFATLASAKKNPLIKDIVGAMPPESVEIMPAPGVVYVTANLSQEQHAQVSCILDKHFKLDETQEFIGHTNMKYIGVPGIVFYAVVKKF